MAVSWPVDDHFAHLDVRVGAVGAARRWDRAAGL